MCDEQYEHPEGRCCCCRRKQLAHSSENSTVPVELPDIYTSCTHVCLCYQCRSVEQAEYLHKHIQSRDNCIYCINLDLFCSLHYPTRGGEFARRYNKTFGLHQGWFLLPNICCRSGCVHQTIKSRSCLLKLTLKSLHSESTGCYLVDQSGFL